VGEGVSLCRDGGSKKVRGIRRAIYKPLMRPVRGCHHLWEMREAASETRPILRAWNTTSPHADAGNSCNPSFLGAGSAGG